MSKLEDRKRKEIEHSDRRRQIVRGYEYFTDTDSDAARTDLVSDRDSYEHHFSNMKFYSVTRPSFAYRDSLLYGSIEGRTVLDYCCGNGEVAVAMAKRGAKEVHGIDISEVAVENAKALAEKEGVGDRCRFAVMDAESMGFADETFDLIHEYGSLHHLDLDAAYKELHRILSPGGRIVATEALRHNPLIRRYRKRTPHLRTEWEAEHILGVPELMRASKYFGTIRIRFWHLLALAAVPFRKTRIFEPLRFVLDMMDRALLSLPLVRRMAWVAVVEYSGRKQETE